MKKAIQEPIWVLFIARRRVQKPKSDQKEENPSLRRKGKIKMAKINPEGIDDEDGNERKAKGSAHLRLKGFSLLIIVGPPATVESDWLLHKSG